MVLFNLLTFRSLGRYGYNRKYGPEAPLISILIPARNEANNIGRCLRSLLSQDYPNLEIIVLDDSSDDATVPIVDTLAKEDLAGRLRLIEGKPLEDGWLGKNFACYQLAQVAQGNYLLFTDADTDHSLRSVTNAMAAMEQEQADFLSVFPRQQTGSLAERLVVPLMIMYIVGLLPVRLVSRNPSPAFSAANGQFMFFRREAYEAIGGHQAVRGVVLEDVVMGRRIKQAGLKQILPDGADSVSCRMYRNSSEVWRGFSKNLFAFFNFELRWFALFMAINLLIFVGPYFWLILGLLTGQAGTPEWTWLPLVQIGLAWFIRLGVAWRFGFRGIDVFLHPFSILYMFVIGINSIIWRRRGTIWKGRTYQPNR